MGKPDPCWACGRSIARLPRRGKQRRPHKCPHGRRCIAGTWQGAQGHNAAPAFGPYGCLGCAARATAADHRAGDERFGRDWLRAGCQCGACRLVRVEMGFGAASAAR